MVFLIGGDGTHRGALALYKEAQLRRVKLSVVVIPKTIDNDIDLIDRSFGFQTAVEQAVHPLNCAHTEALATNNGIGLVKLMGRASGFIALYAALASRDVNVTLIPEAPWRVSSLCAFIEKRLGDRGHVLIAVAEGAESIEQQEAKAKAKEAAAAGLPVPPVKTDESGNPVLDDVGIYLRDQINAYFKAKKTPVNLKYIDPSYIIRSAPANAADADLCASLAFAAVHGAMAGRTGFSVGLVDNVIVYLPITTIVTGKARKVDPEGRLFARLCIGTGQPYLG